MVPAILEISGEYDRSFSAAAIPLGGVLLRITDPGTIGLICGLLYLYLKRDQAVFHGKHLGAITLAMALFLCLKVAITMTLGAEALSENRTVSHALGGLVAAFGDLRDNFVAFLVPIYLYFAPEASDLSRMVPSIFWASLILLLRGAVHIVKVGSIWSNTADDRFVSSHEAMSLFLFSLILSTAHYGRLPNWVMKTLTAVLLLTVTIANHRSVWSAALACAVILGLLVLAGSIHIGDDKVTRLTIAGVLFVATTFWVLIPVLDTISSRYEIVKTITVRLYALTDPNRDADSKWRRYVWEDRAAQVGSDWPWGRLLGDRRETLMRGVWLPMPDHSAYVETYELGGVFLCMLTGFFWIGIAVVSVRRITGNVNAQKQPAILALLFVVGSLAYGVAYDYPWIGPSLALAYTIGGDRYAVGSRRRRISELDSAFLQAKSSG